MKLFDRFKEWMGIRRLLRDLPQDRKPLPRNLSAARKVALVYVIEDEAAHNQVRNYVKRIKEDIGINHIMAMVLWIASPDHTCSQLNFDYCTLKPSVGTHSSWGTIENFLAEEYDVHELHTGPLRYRHHAKSRARFKWAVSDVQAYST